jgi:hypothetical protein
MRPLKTRLQGKRHKHLSSLEMKQITKRHELGAVEKNNKSAQLSTYVAF